MIIKEEHIGIMENLKKWAEEYIKLRGGWNNLELAEKESLNGIYPHQTTSFKRHGNYIVFDDNVAVRMSDELIKELK